MLSVQITFKEVRSAESLNPHHRIVRLEKSIAWLKDQHGQMVAGLHNEIETLKHRNRGQSAGGGESRSKCDKSIKRNLWPGEV